jgi:SAM-dependent methyltransferase
MSGTCELCGGDQPQARMRFGRFALLECGGCGASFVDPRPDAGAASRIYDEKYLSHLTANARSSQAFFLEMRKVVARHKPAGSVLDIGFGAGHFLRIMRDAGYTVTGLETSRSACDFVRQHHGIERLHCGDLASLDLAETFDVVTLWDSLQYTTAPARYIARAAQLLKPSGVLIVQVPNRGRLNLSYARVLYGLHRELARSFLHVPAALTLFSERSLRALVEREGLRLLSFVDDDRFRKYRWSRGFGLKSIASGVIENTAIALEKLFDERHPLIAVAEKAPASPAPPAATRTHSPATRP